MTQWRLDPDGVRGVVTLVGQLQSELGESMRSLDVAEVMSAVSWGGAYTAAVPEALAALMTDQEANVMTIAARVQAGLHGTVNAVIAYQAGQEDMVATFQGEMFASAESGDVSFFEQYGYTGGDGA